MSDLSDVPAGCSGESIALPLKSVNVKQRNHILSFTPISKRLTSNPTKLVYYFKNRKNILWAMVKIFSGSCIVTLVVAFGFLPQILGGGGDLRMVLCRSMDIALTHAGAKELPCETST